MQSGLGQIERVSCTRYADEHHCNLFWRSTSCQQTYEHCRNTTSSPCDERPDRLSRRRGSARVHRFALNETGIVALHKTPHGQSATHAHISNKVQTERLTIVEGGSGSTEIARWRLELEGSFSQTGGHVIMSRRVREGLPVGCSDSSLSKKSQIPGPRFC